MPKLTGVNLAQATVTRNNFKSLIGRRITAANIRGDCVLVTLDSGQRVKIMIINGSAVLVCVEMASHRR